MQDWVEQHHHKALNNAQLAQQFGFSERNLKRRFKSATGLSPIVLATKIAVGDDAESVAQPMIDRRMSI